MILTRLPRELALSLRGEIAVRDQLAIETLRDSIEARRENAHEKPTVERVMRIVQGVLSFDSLTTIGAAMGLSDQAAGERMVLDVVAAFGTWLGHSRGTTEVRVTNAGDYAQLPLMQMPHLGLIPSSGSGVKRKRDAAEDIPTVVVPEGFEPTASHGRDVIRALSLVIVNHPDAETVSRFVSRTYKTRSADLTYPVIAGVWDFAQRGRLANIHKVSDDIVFQTLVVEAYDLLDVARRDAVSALQRLASPATDLEDLHRSIVQSRWLAPNDVARIERRVGLDDSGVDLRREQLLLAQRIEDEPLRLRPESIAELSLGQVLRIAEAAGIPVADTRASEVAIRAELKTLGLSVDADRLVPEALRAASRGRLDGFWDVMQARIDGDTNWADQLEALLAE